MIKTLARATWGGSSLFLLIIPRSQSISDGRNLEAGTEAEDNGNNSAFWLACLHHPLSTNCLEVALPTVCWDLLRNNQENPPTDLPSDNLMEAIPQLGFTPPRQLWLCQVEKQQQQLTSTEFKQDHI